MLDTELLEDAALAAGIRYVVVMGHLLVHDRPDPAVGREWNPIESAGDLHVLARTLKMRVDFAAGTVACSHLLATFTPGNAEEEARAIVGLAALLVRNPPGT